jgi:NAD-dependent SIR2 family protein deacetylase
MKRMEYRVNRGKTCIVSGCGNMAKVKGFCIRCYQKKRKEGKNMIKSYRCIYCGRKFISEELLKDHIIKFGTHV